MKTYIFDIDGTIANTEHRQHYLASSPKDWKGWHDNSQKDTPHWEITEILDMAREKGIKIVLCTGRDEKCRDETIEWFVMHGIHFDALYMRKAGDRRDDDIVKRELLTQIRSVGYDPVCVFEDRARVVKMWREEGLRCLQVAPGEF